MLIIWRLDLTLYLSVHWGASQEQTSTWITESLRQHDQSLPVVWLIFTNNSSKCDRCKIGVDILRRNWMLTFKVYTRTPLEVDCGWSLPWVEIPREIKDKNLWGRRICSLPSSNPCFILTENTQHCRSCQKKIFKIYPKEWTSAKKMKKWDAKDSISTKWNVATNQKQEAGCGL